MKPQAADPRADVRRSTARRTALLVGGVAAAIYLLSILEVVLKR